MQELDMASFMHLYFNAGPICVVNNWVEVAVQQSDRWIVQGIITNWYKRSWGDNCLVCLVDHNHSVMELKVDERDVTLFDDYYLVLDFVNGPACGYILGVLKFRRMK